MATLNKNIMALPTPNPNDFDYNSFIKFLASLISFIGAYVYYINKHFKNKDREREAFIQAITDKAIDTKLTTYKTEFSEYKVEFHKFKTNIEDKMDRFNNTVLDILDEVKKS
jgi:hypothetical protein